MLYIEQDGELFARFANRLRFESSSIGEAPRHARETADRSQREERIRERGSAIGLSFAEPSLVRPADLPLEQREDRVPTTRAGRRAGGKLLPCCMLQGPEVDEDRDGSIGECALALLQALVL